MNTTILIRMTVHHGDYREVFYGSGPDIRAAAEEVSSMSSYSSGLFDVSSSYHEVRGKHRADLVETLEAFQEYRGFGWCTYARVS